MRADVNVSVRKAGEPLGTRTETKNVNSVRFVMAVVEHEAKRQVELLEVGRRSIRKRASTIRTRMLLVRSGPRKMRTTIDTSRTPTSFHSNSMTRSWRIVVRPFRNCPIRSGCAMKGSA